jgi:malonyl-CoA/methylmalonyl-CoA synthetase
MLKIIEKAEVYAGRRGIISGGKLYSYNDILQRSHLLASVILDSKSDLAETCVAFMVSPGFEYVATQWAIWRAGGVGVPLCITNPPPSLLYVIENVKAPMVVVAREYQSIVEPLTKPKGIRLIVLEDLADRIALSQLPTITSGRKAMILYTSGTTSLPKGVVTTHKNIEAQVVSLVDAWKWTRSDHILCVLPLHHVHGVINVICCALWSGATVQFAYPFASDAVFDVFAKGKVNIFMAVPTIYFKLVSHWESLDEMKRADATRFLSKFRLMVSGSAALPVSIMEKWKAISTHTLLERYGMTEIGMAISNPYEGERKPGYVGQPLPGVAVRLVDGEIQIKGDNVFQEYWKSPEATARAFTPDGWFRTGDVAVVEDGYYRILGRDSVDNIKSGGYKISALEIEEVLRTHPLVTDCSVVGLDDEEWGELVAAALTVRDKTLDVKELSNWLRQTMPAYKTPRRFVVVEELPRNAMGKIVKNDVKKFFKR